MTLDQSLITALLVGLLGLFLWGRWRYDMVAFVALVVATMLGLVPAREMFAGFGHPATVTVALVLVIGRGLQNAGAVDLVSKHLMPPIARPEAHIGVLSSVAAMLSAVMNNVGALALLMPAAMASAKQVKRSAAQVLMPLSFGSILGGLMTLIGTPPNIIIATAREDVAGQPFGMFDFAPVGATVAFAGIAFVSFIGWRLVPKARRTAPPTSDVIGIENYVSEARVPRDSASIGKPLRELDKLADEFDASILEVLRRGRRFAIAGRRTAVRAGDVLLIEASPEAIDAVRKSLDLRPTEHRRKSGGLFGTEDLAIMEAVVGMRSPLIGQTAASADLRRRHGINLLAVSRQGKPLRERLRAIHFKLGDVLLLQGDDDRLPDAAASLRCLPLAQRTIAIGKTHLAGLAVFMFAASIAAAAFGVVALPLALAIAAGLMVITYLVSVRDIYEAVDWPVVVLLGAMIPIGGALQTTGVTTLAAQGLLAVTAGTSPVVALVLLMAVTMTLSDVINNAATAVVMAPIGIAMSNSLSVNPDAFLMAVAISASCAFLTPIGHQNNMLIMGPGGYRFGDYWRMGLPLEILVIAVSIPLLLIVWPL